MVTGKAAASKSGLYARSTRGLACAAPGGSHRSSSVRSSTPHHHLWDRGGQRYLIEEITGRHRLRPQHRGHRLCRLPLDVPRRRAGSLPPGGRSRIRQRRRGDERERRLRQRARSAPASSATSICCSATARARCSRRKSPPATAASAASGIPRRGMPMPTSPASTPRRPKGLLLDPDLSQGICLPRAARPEFRCLAVPSADRRTDRSGPRLSGHQDRARSLRRSGRHRPLRQPARGDLPGLAGVDPARSPNAPMSWSSWAAWRCGCSATTFTNGRCRHRRKTPRRRGGPTSRPASRPSARSAACSRAISRPTRASAAIR